MPSAPPEIVATWKPWTGKPVASRPPCPLLPDREIVSVNGVDRAKVEAKGPAKRTVDVGTHFGRVAVINLSRRADRLASFRSRPWPFDVKASAAIDARWATLGGNAAAACLLSHLSVVAQAIADGLDSVLILEDDAEPVEGFAEKLRAFLSAVPGDWECLMLGGQLFPESQAVDCGGGVRAVSHCERLHAYALSRAGMVSLADYWGRSVGHCDHRIAEWQDAGHRTYAPESFIVAQAEGTSDITRESHPRRMFDATDPPAIARAVPDNLAVLTVGCYPASEVGDRLALLEESAAQWGIPLTVLGAGEEYRSHYSAKVARLQTWIERLPAHVTHVVYLDGKDTFFNGSVWDLCDVLNACGDDGTIEPKPIVGMESTCWPDQTMAGRFPTFPHGRNYINAGVFGGERGAVLVLLRELSKLYARLFDDTHRDNDQHLWNIARMEGLPMQTDGEGRLAANTYALDPDAPPNDQFELADGRIRWRDNGVAPCIVHFSGQDGTARDRWWNTLKGSR